MALRNPSLMLYGFEITALNRYISFGTSAGENPGSMTTRTATLTVGFYSLTTLATEVARALAASDSTHTYTVSVDRTIAGGLENRVTISTDYSYLAIYFSTGNPSNPGTLLGFGSVDLTGSTSYTGTATAGTALIPNQLGYNFLSPTAMQKNFGVLNISASGLKESIVFALQSFWQVQFKYIPESLLESDWLPWVQWMIQQREFDFTPDITDPTTFYTGTLEDPNQGLDFTFSEMLPNFPFNYQTPIMKFRVRPTS